MSAAATAVAVVSALIIMFYDGFVMKSSLGVAFWRTSLLPVMLLMYATLGGITLSLTIRALQGQMASPTLLELERGLLLVNLMLLVGYLARMSHSFPAAQETLRMWVRGPYARVFFGLVLVVGLLATFSLLVVEKHVQASWLVILIAVCELTGDFALVMLLLKSGLFPTQGAPQHSKVA
jgi:formate-dependent nitrite reductase membrane component NrfD